MSHRQYAGAIRPGQLEKCGGTGKWNSHKCNTSALPRYFLGSGQCQPLEPVGAHAILCVAGHGCRWRTSAEAFRQLAHHLHAHEPVVEERRPGPRVRAPAAGAGDPDPGRGSGSRQHQYQGTPRWHGRLRKNGPALVMDRAYEDVETRQLATDLDFMPVAPPKSNRVAPWEYDRKSTRPLLGASRYLFVILDPKKVNHGRLIIM